ncbi:response regulator DrrA [Fulvivirga imtechensis AK7]|uniref:Response regulator DrrA n=1 Tax=Fulvivirga imtechensis AK7 TaxID=1237149 RepID=L8JY72_9BACT|nr:response regulator [Fulvivirga imtechensis]ELR73720.1 response regulator DrrA [Fulvivirga imtechensis AK7]
MKKKVLLCDNDPDIIEIVSLILSGKGFQVFISTNCEEVPQKIDKYDPDLIIMDLWIPEMGGEKATVLLKNTPKYQDIPVIILSANNEIENISKRSGADGFIAKPFEIKELVDKINSYINGGAK